MARLPNGQRKRSAGLECFVLGMFTVGGGIVTALVLHALYIN